jgi:hypothetical protein
MVVRPMFLWQIAMGRLKNENNRDSREFETRWALVSGSEAATWKDGRGTGAVPVGARARKSCCISPGGE